MFPQTPRLNENCFHGGNFLQVFINDDIFRFSIAFIVLSLENLIEKDVEANFYYVKLFVRTHQGAYENQGSFSISNVQSRLRQFPILRRGNVKNGSKKVKACRITLWQCTIIFW